MRRVAAMTIALLVLLWAPTAVTGQEEPPAPNDLKEAGRGAGKVEDLDLGGGEISFAVSAFSTDVDSAQGQVHLRSEGGSLVGDVTSVEVRDNEAVVGATPRRADGVFSQCTRIVLTLVDNGPPKPDPPPDELTGTCDGRSFGGELIEGNIVVVDDPDD